MEVRSILLAIAISGCVHTPGTYDILCRRNGRTYLEITIPEREFDESKYPAGECLVMHSSVGKLFP